MSFSKQAKLLMPCSFVIVLPHLHAFSGFSVHTVASNTFSMAFKAVLNELQHTVHDEMNVDSL